MVSLERQTYVRLSPFCSTPNPVQIFNTILQLIAAMTESVPPSFAVANFNDEGELLTTHSVNTAELDPETLAWFEKKTSRLSGDLELPLESRLPGEFSQIEFRIGSDRHAAYVLFYLDDEVVYASLYLRGRDEINEKELTQVFKFLLLDTSDDDDPTEEEIEEILSSPDFDFDAIADRPIAHSVQFSDPEEGTEALNHIQNMDRHLAAAFLFHD